MRLRNLLTAAMLFALLLAVFPAVARAQANTSGSVVGQVTDSSGGVVAGATVTLTDEGTGEKQTIPSNDAGRYIFANVRLGTYTVTVEKTGFSTAQIKGQGVSVGATTTVNLKLQVGAASTTVEVSSTPGAELQTMNATMGTALNSTAMLLMPNIGHDASSLLTYQPATTSSGQVAGGILDQNTFMLDGGNNTDDLDGSNTAYNDPFAGSGSGVVPTPSESLEELKVATNNQTADFGNSSGGEIMMVTKRGTSQYHGSAYDYYQANWLDADTWANNRLNTPLITQHQNRFGGAFGGQLLPKMLGGKTYFYVNYEGRRYPNAQTEEDSVPSPSLRAGILTFANAAGTNIQYNLATSAACGAPTTSNPSGGGQACDPRHIGIDPDVSYEWNNLIPAGNDPSAGDTLNTWGFRGNLSYPIKDDFVVGRFDHDFGQNWRAFLSYRWWREQAPSTAQLDLGGITPGDTFGQYAADASKPLQPDYWVLGITGQVTPNVTNEFNFNFVRNWWAWNTAGVPYVLAGEGVQAGVSIEGNSNGGSGMGLDPIDVGWGDARSRFWLGHDWNYKDDLSWLKGNHLIQMGMTLNHYYLRNSENDANSAIATLRYILNSSSVAVSANYRPPVCGSGVGTDCIPSSETTAWDTLYYATLGVVGQSNVVNTRVGPSLALQPNGSPEFDTVLIDNMAPYLNDSWHLRPSFTLNLGLTYVHTTTPYENAGKQTLIVDPAGDIETAGSYFATKESDALQGINYNPQLGFDPIQDLGSPGNPATMIQPFWGGFEPRVAFAWNPSFSGGWAETLFGHDQTVLRGGWSRLIDRLNNVGTVVSSILGDGFVQQNVCNGAIAPQFNGGVAACEGIGGVTAANAFRLGVDGTTVPMPALTPTLQTPILPGVNQPSQGVVQALDYDWRPGVSDEFTLSLQRQLPGSMILELGYVGRHGRDVAQTVNLNTVPYMFTEGGQTLAQAYLGISQDVLSLDNIVPKGATFTAQPFFEAALGGPNSSYCKGYVNCTTAVIQNESSNISKQLVETTVQDIDRANGWIFGPMLMSSGGLTGGITDGVPDGVDNYDAGTISLNKRSSHGLTINSNFTWARSLDDGESTQVFENSSATANPFDEGYDYGPSGFGYKYTFNLTGVYQLPFAGSQRGILGRLAGGWSFAPIFVWHNGSILSVSDSTQAFGQPGSNADAILENTAVLAGDGPTHIMAPTSIGSTGNAGAQENYFTNPQAVYNALRPPLLGLDTSAITNIGYGPQYWNLNFNLVKDVQFTERIGATFTAEFLNAFNHATWGNPSLSYTSSTSFGVISSASNSPGSSALTTAGRQVELGVRVHF